MNLSSLARCVPLLFIPWLGWASPIEWLPPDLVAARERAQREDKLFLLYFTADWCAPCRWMEENTFHDEELQEHLNHHVLSVRVDLNHALAKELQHRFEVEAIPTLLIFATNGSLIDRRTASLDAKALLRWLKRVDKPAHHVKAAAPEPDTPPALNAPRPGLGFSRPALLPDEAETPALTERPPGRTPTLVLSGEPLAATETGLAPRAGLAYGVRLTDATVDYATAIRMIGELERKYERPVEMYPAAAGAFHLVCGRFATTGEAQAFLRFLRRNDRQGEVIPLE